MDYLKTFNEEISGPLHEQAWVQDEFSRFNDQMDSLKQFFCSNCHELWPTSEPECKQCKISPIRYSKVKYFFCKGHFLINFIYNLLILL